eukprot:TRINITY_DN20_c1_g1_i3.p1 TRINITY_DN20_c1_g1~~TRINITY_DN20_c1_g1_i3.p1  ORF type:complete len:457 (+),score=128.66 TRINITY_DN20_c1_g1_i3:59-1372(+)
MKAGGGLFKLNNAYANNGSVLARGFTVMRSHTTATTAAASTSSPLFALYNTRGYALPTEATVVRYESNGRPDNVLKVQKEKIPAVKQGEVLVGIIAAPINPADINMIEGVYPIGPKAPAVPGNEGVAEVLAVGDGVSDLSVGDWVIPAAPGFGTWRTHAVAPSKDLLKVRKTLQPEYIASLSVNPCTAYRLLEDFAQLKSGDVIIQNGANGAVGQAVIQLAALRGIKTINIIRERPNYDNTVERMKAYGGYIVAPEVLLGTPEYRRLVSDLPAPRLALNCVGGTSATEIARTLGQDGVLVTYGGMSRKPVQLPTSLFIFKNISSKGFWLSKWAEQNNTEKRMEMFNKVYDLAMDRKLRLWLERHPLTDSQADISAAVRRATAEQRDRKVLLTMADLPLHPSASSAFAAPSNNNNNNNTTSNNTTSNNNTSNTSNNKK